MFYFHVRGLIGPHSYCQITSVEFSPLRQYEKNFLSAHWAYCLPSQDAKNRPELESKASMYLLTSAMGLFGTNIYDFLLRVMGSEILRTIASFIIRSALTRIGLWGWFLFWISPTGSLIYFSAYRHLSWSRHYVSFSIEYGALRHNLCGNVWECESKKQHRLRDWAT